MENILHVVIVDKNKNQRYRKNGDARFPAVMASLSPLKEWYWNKQQICQGSSPVS